MRKRRLVLSLFLFVAVALLSMGYAALSRDLNATGKLASSTDNNNLKVYFVPGTENYRKDIVDVERSADALLMVDESEYVVNNTSVQFTVKNLSSEGDTVTLYFLIENSSADETLDAILTSPVVTMKVSGTSTTVDDKDGSKENNIFVGDHFRVTASYVNQYPDEPVLSGTVDEGELGAQLDAKGEATNGDQVWLKVVIKVENTIQDADFKLHHVSVEFNATSYNAAPAQAEPTNE